MGDLVKVRWSNYHNQWMVEVPAKVDPKRPRQLFKDKLLAETTAARKELELLSGQKVPDPKATSITVSRLIKVYLSEKESLPKDTFRGMKNHLTKYEEQFGSLAADAVPPLQARNWLATLHYRDDKKNSIPYSQRTKHGVFATVRTFYSWAVRYDFATVNPFTKMEIVEKGDAGKAILTVAQMKKVLQADKHPYMQAWLVLGGFAGLRTEEIYRLSWDSVDLKAGEIHVTPEAIKKTRGMAERYVAILPACARWLKMGKGEIIPISKTVFHSHVKRLAKILDPNGKNPWPRNCLRHSFASYLLAETEDAGKVAHQLGHTSPVMVHKNYARAVKKAEAEKWFAL